MENIHNIDRTNKYVQGSVWMWENNVGNNNRRTGVQSGDRPVLIVSNNTFNHYSAAVNCVSITSQLKDSPVHVPLYINKDSHIQCEQLHTIPKSELTEFRGIVPNATLSTVKAKLRIQLDMSGDRNTELFNSIKRILDEMNAKANKANPETAETSETSEKLEAVQSGVAALHEKADKGFGIPELEDQILGLLVNLGESFKKIEVLIENLPAQTAVKPQEAAPAAAVPAADARSGVIKPGRGNRRHYTEEDKRFIADKRNSISDVMAKYGYERNYVHRIRAIFRKQLENQLEEIDGVVNGNESSDDAAKRPKYKHYTEEDKEFILNKRNSAEELMERYGFKDKMSAYKARAYIKRKLPKNYAEESGAELAEPETVEIIEM